MGRPVLAALLALAAASAEAVDPCGIDFASASPERPIGNVPVWDLPPAGQWRVVRRDAGQRIREGCGVGVIEAPLASVREVLDAADEFDAFIPGILESDVEPIAPGVYLNSQVLDVPYPFRDRRYTVRIESGVLDAVAGGGWRARWSYVEGSGNVRESAGSWTLVPAGPERTVVIYRLLVDPGGRLPTWILDRAAPRVMRRILRAVRERVLGGPGRSSRGR